MPADWPTRPVSEGRNFGGVQAVSASKHLDDLAPQRPGAVRETQNEWKSLSHRINLMKRNCNFGRPQYAEMSRASGAHGRGIAKGTLRIFAFAGPLLPIRRPVVR